MKHGKRYNDLLKKYEIKKLYGNDEAVSLVVDMANAKFAESFDVSIKLNLLSKHTVRDTVVLPNQSGKTKKVLVFAKGENVALAEAAGADFVGSDELVEKIKGGWFDFDVAIATPDMMRDIGKLGAHLGRRGLMPNPKTGTVTKDVASAVKEFKKGKTEFRADKKGVVNLSIGVVKMEKKELVENVLALYSGVLKKKPTDLKGEYIKSLTYSSTMGPGVSVDFKSI